MFAALGDRIAAERYFALDDDGCLAGSLGIQFGGIADRNRFQRIALAVGVEATRAAGDAPGSGARADDQAKAGATRVGDADSPPVNSGAARISRA